jgi:hypothetical protein
MKPIRVKSVLPAETLNDMPSLVRIKPWINQGCLPISAVTHSAVFAPFYPLLGDLN